MEGRRCRKLRTAHISDHLFSDFLPQFISIPSVKRSIPWKVRAIPNTSLQPLQNSIKAGRLNVQSPSPSSTSLLFSLLSSIVCSLSHSWLLLPSSSLLSSSLNAVICWLWPGKPFNATLDNEHDGEFCIKRYVGIWFNTSCLLTILFQFLEIKSIRG